MTSVVRLDGVTRRFDTPAETVTAVDDVTLTVSAGEFVGLVGPSGSGKTTALNLIAGWESPDEGTVSRHIAHAGWRGLAVVPQELGLLPELTARENVELAARLVPGPGAGHGHDTNGGSGLGDLFEALGLAELTERFPAELSMGEQQRLAVARAVALEPELLIADEPTAHQDEQRADLVMDRLVAVAATGGAVIVATHDLRLLDRVDREVRMLDGRISDLTVARHSRR